MSLRLRSNNRAGTTQSLLSSFSDSSSSSSRLQSTLTLYHYRLGCLLTQSRPSAADEYASAWWSDLTGSFYDPSSVDGSRSAGATRSDDEDVGRDEDDDDE